MYAKKAGIVSLPLLRPKSAHFLKKSGVMNCINYTLCVFKAPRTGNGFGKTFAQKLGFYTTAIIRCTSSTLAAFRPGFLVTPGHVLMGERSACNPRCSWLPAADSFQNLLKLFHLWLLPLSKLFRPSACCACTYQAVDNSQSPQAFDAPGSGSFPPPVPKSAVGFLSRIPKYLSWLRGRPAQGFPAQNFGQHAQREKAEGSCPSEKPPLTLSLTAEELRTLSFAVYCEVTALQDGPEADELAVMTAIDHLNAISGRLIALEKGLEP